MNIRHLMDRKNLEIDFGAETLHVAYQPQIVTPAWLRKVEGLQTGMTLLPEALADLLVSWDLKDELEGLVPITAESLAQLPAAFLNRIATAVFADLTPPPPPEFEEIKR